MFDRMAAWSPREWGRAALFAAAAGIILYIVVAAWVVLLPFLFGLIGAWIILPAVNWVERRLAALVRRPGVARLLAILAVYAVILGLIVAFSIYFVPRIFRQAEELFARRASISQAISANLAGLQRWYEATVPASIRRLIQQQIPSTPEEWLALLERDVLLRLVATVRSSGPVLLGYLIVPFWLIYLLYDVERLRRASLGLWPEGAGPDLVNLGRLLNDVAGAYLRGQIVVALTTGLLSSLALLLLGVNFALLLGALIAILDLIPTFGPIIAAIPVLIIAALQSPILALWALLAIIAIRELEDLLLGPRIVGSAVRIRPAFIIVLLLVAGHLWGFLGLLLAVPVTAVLRDIFRYLNLRTSRPQVTPDEALRRVRLARRRSSRQPQ